MRGQRGGPVWRHRESWPNWRMLLLNTGSRKARVQLQNLCNHLHSVCAHLPNTSDTVSASNPFNSPESSHCPNPSHDVTLGLIWNYLHRFWSPRCLWSRPLLLINHNGTVTPDTSGSPCSTCSSYTPHMQTGLCCFLSFPFPSFLG